MRARYLRPAGSDPGTRSVTPRKASLARDGYEVLAERTSRDPSSYERPRELTETEYEPSLHDPYDREC